jgi:hypothetical protein
MLSSNASSTVVPPQTPTLFRIALYEYTRSLICIYPRLAAQVHLSTYRPRKGRGLARPKLVLQSKGGFAGQLQRYYK